MFDITPLTGVFGAEISNIDLAAGWDDETISKIRETLRDHKVVVIRDQHRLTAQQLADFTRNFGEPETRDHPLHASFPGVPEVKMLKSDGDTQHTKGGEALSWGDMDGWHTDGS